MIPAGMKNTLERPESLIRSRASWEPAEYPSAVSRKSRTRPHRCSYGQRQMLPPTAKATSWSLAANSAVRGLIGVADGRPNRLAI